MSTLTAEQHAENVAWAERGDFRPVAASQVSAEDNRAFLESCGLDIAALEARVTAARGRPRLAADDDTVPLTFRATTTQAEQVRAQAKREGRPFAAIMRDAVTDYLAAHPA
ncbi:MAG: hypothetical protein FWG11_01185 [Promicromonosporaceae bacterium]|nr:hypothetical protein [Promicromonosporaceae bacterium]